MIPFSMSVLSPQNVNGNGRDFQGEDAFDLPHETPFQHFLSLKRTIPFFFVHRDLICYLIYKPYKNWDI